MTEVPGATFDLPGIYEWIIEGRGSYIGKFTRSRRPLSEYANNVAKIEDGRAYRRLKPEGFRRIHRELADAKRDGRRVVLSCVLNCDPAELNAREAELIQSRGTLNGPVLIDRRASAGSGRSG